jgi:hypothetical protein
MKTAMAIVAWLVCAACVYVYVRDNARHRQEMAEVRAEMEAFQRAVDHVMPAVELRHARARAVEATAAPATTVSPSPAAGAGDAIAATDIPERGTVLSAEERQALSEAMVTQAELTFASEGIDESWAGSTARAIDDALSSALPASASMYGVDCRTSLCRVELAFSDEGARERFESDVLLRSTTWRGGLLISHEDPASALVYLAREGHERALALD